MQRGNEQRLKLEEAIRRVRNDFLEMPGLLLTQPQASRLFGLDADLCEQVLDVLVEMGFLVRSGRAGFSLAR